MLRALVALLLLANLAYFALARGWLEPTFGPSRQREREPQRLAAQIDPQSLQLLSPAAASAAVAQAERAEAANAVACLQAGPFRPGEAAAVEALLAPLKLPGSGWSRINDSRPESWWLVLDRLEDREADRRQQEQAKFAGYGLEPFGGSGASGETAGATSIGSFDSRPAAEAAMGDARERGVRGLRLVALPRSTRAWLRVPQADAALRSKLALLPLSPPEAAFAPCPP